MTGRVFVINQEDWVTVYVNGKLAQQGHRLDLDRLFEDLGVEYETVWLEGEWDDPLNILIAEFPADYEDQLPLGVRPE